MTDGQENASREFSHDKITSLLKSRQEQGWLVTFLGQGLDVAKQGVQIGMHVGRVASYVDGAGLRRAGGVMAASSSRYVQSQDAAFTPEERDALAGKTKK